MSLSSPIMEALWMPLNNYLEHLPCWDGKDRVTALAHRHPLLGETEGVAATIPYRQYFETNNTRGGGRKRHQSD